MTLINKTIMLRNTLICLSACAILSVADAKGQTDSGSVSATLGKLFDRLLVVSDDSVRIRINDSIKVIVGNYARTDTAFNHRFDNVKFLGQVTSPDSVIKLLTWNLNLRNSPGRYYLYIIRRSRDRHPDNVYEMTSEYKSAMISSDTVYYAENWYGALYYGIMPQVINGVKCWILLGIDYGNPDITRKIIETLYFDRNEKIIFGIKSFMAEESVKYRALFEYSSEATMTLRFGGDDSVIFDHLVPFSPELENQKRYYGPHYTNDAYFLENGRWILKLNVDARNRERINTNIPVEGDAR